jgi:hypothetical protein
MNVPRPVSCKDFFHLRLNRYRTDNTPNIMKCEDLEITLNNNVSGPVEPAGREEK